MNEIKSVNQKCLENILCHLTKMVILTEHDEIDDLKQLIKMSTSVSAQLLGVCKYEESIKDESNECIDYCNEMTSEEIEKYINENDGKLSNDDMSHIINNPQIDHLKYNYEKAEWEMWDNTGKYFEFQKC